MKRIIQGQLSSRAEAAHHWLDALNRMGSDPEPLMRASFIANRAVCALGDYEELACTFRTLWPEDQQWLRFTFMSLEEIASLRSRLIGLGEEVAEEEAPIAADFASAEFADLIELLVAARKALCFYSARDGQFDRGVSKLADAVGSAFRAVSNLDTPQKELLATALTGLITGSVLYPTAKLTDGRNLRERYRPLYRLLHNLGREHEMENDDSRSALTDLKLSSQTRGIVETLFDSLRRLVSDLDLDQIQRILEDEGQLFPDLQSKGVLTVIAGRRSGARNPVALAVAIGRDSKSRRGLPNIMRQVRAHMIQCFGTCEVVVLLTDTWDPARMHESVEDFKAHSLRMGGQTVLIPVVVWKQKVTVYQWP